MLFFELHVSTALREEVPLSKRSEHLGQPSGQTGQSRLDPGHTNHSAIYSAFCQDVISAVGTRAVATLRAAHQMAADEPAQAALGADRGLHAHVHGRLRLAALLPGRLDVGAHRLRARLLGRAQAAQRDQAERAQCALDGAQRQLPGRRLRRPRQEGAPQGPVQGHADHRRPPLQTRAARRLLHAREEHRTRRIGGLSQCLRPRTQRQVRVRERLGRSRCLPARHQDLGASPLLRHVNVCHQWSADVH